MATATLMEPTEKRAESATPRSLAQKLVEVMDEVKSVDKKGDHEQGWKYVKAADVAIPIRAALIKRKVLIIPSVVSQTYWDMPAKSGTARRGVDLVVEYTLLDADSGETIKANGYGSGLDSGDRYSYKAHTGAWKYFVRMLFQLPDEQGDPEFEKQKTYGEAANEAAHAFPMSGTVMSVQLVEKGTTKELFAQVQNDGGNFVCKATTDPEISHLLDSEGEHHDFVVLDTLSKSNQGLPIFRVLKVNPTHEEMLWLTKGVKPEEPADKKGKK